mmetsp:Transcript_18294/g.41619  ORF Transcript_18294/g.41619 Transcript_18294/m.41619 type:complete len:226 (+) Transcript_18294:265-942(+)
MPAVDNAQGLGLVEHHRGLVAEHREVGGGSRSAKGQGLKLVVENLHQIRIFCSIQSIEKCAHRARYHRFFVISCVVDNLVRAHNLYFSIDQQFLHFLLAPHLIEAAIFHHDRLESAVHRVHRRRPHHPREGVPSYHHRRDVVPLQEDPQPRLPHQVRSRPVRLRPCALSGRRLEERRREGRGWQGGGGGGGRRGRFAVVEREGGQGRGRGGGGRGREGLVQDVVF